jgi:cell wall-associated NlpC family hydrolase
MKTKQLLILVTFTVVGLMLNTCKKDDELSFAEGIQEEILSDEEIAYCDNLESVEITTDEILLPNGYTVKEFLQMMDPEFSNEWNKKGILDNNNLGQLNLKNTLLGKMATVAAFLTTDENFIYPREGDFKPAQNGLAYSFGQRDYKARKVPPYGACMEEVYGLDCSGFIHQLFKQSGVTEGLDGTAEQIRQPSRLTRYIKKALPGLDKLKVEDLGKKPLSSFLTGDIIYWLKPDGTARHIGMVVTGNANELLITQSNGSGESDCEGNFGQGRGPRNWNLRDAINPRGLGTNYGIVRIGVEVPDPPDFNKCGVMIRIYGYYHEVAPTYTRDTESNNGTIECITSAKGSFNENVFTGSYTTKVGTVDISGSITAVLNEGYDAVTNLKWTEKRTFGTFPYGTRTTSCELVNVPKINYNFQVEGENACKHIASLKNDQESPQGLSYTLTNHKCTSGSKVMIYFSKE